MHIHIKQYRISDSLPPIAAHIPYVSARMVDQSYLKGALFYIPEKMTLATYLKNINESIRIFHILPVPMSKAVSFYIALNFSISLDISNHRFLNPLYLWLLIIDKSELSYFFKFAFCFKSFYVLGMLTNSTCGHCFTITCEHHLPSCIRNDNISPVHGDNHMLKSMTI